MTSPPIRLATDVDLRAITSSDLAPLGLLPHLYIPVGAVEIPVPPLSFPTEGLDLMRTWGIAHERTLADYVRLFPDALVAPRNFGQFVDRGELVYNGAQAAADFIRQPV